MYARGACAAGGRSCVQPAVCETCPPSSSSSHSPTQAPEPLQARALHAVPAGLLDTSGHEPMAGSHVPSPAACWHSGSTGHKTGAGVVQRSAQTREAHAIVSNRHGETTRHAWFWPATWCSAVLMKACPLMCTQMHRQARQQGSSWGLPRQPLTDAGASAVAATNGAGRARRLVGQG